MKLPMKQSRRFKPSQCGMPSDIRAKKQLRNRSMPLTDTQRQVLNKMGIRLSRNATEKDAVKIAKRICSFDKNYKEPGHISQWTRKGHSAKPKAITARQHRISLYLHRMATPFTTIVNDEVIRHSGSKRAEKMLSKA